MASATVKHYYVAVGTPCAKLSTLVELLSAMNVSDRKGVAVCCGSRDALDEIVTVLCKLTQFNVSVLHSDMSDKERELQVSNVKRSSNQQELLDLPCTSPNHPTFGSSPPSLSSSLGAAPMGSSFPTHRSPSISPSPLMATDRPLPPALVTTDVALKALPKEVLPLGLALLIHYDLPTRKDVLQRRISAVFGGGKERRGAVAGPLMVCFVVAGQVGEFRALERFSGGPIMEVPLHVPDMFKASA